jgi:hypothetical protein
LHGTLKLLINTQFTKHPSLGKKKSKQNHEPRV